MAVKSLKMTLSLALKKENVANYNLFNLSVPEFSYLILKNFYDVISDKR